LAFEGERKRFFFEKKNQKTFALAGAGAGVPLIASGGGD
jgi:hypothetical protein